MTTWPLVLLIQCNTLYVQYSVFWSVSLAVNSYGLKLTRIFQGLTVYDYTVTYLAMFSVLWMYQQYKILIVYKHFCWLSLMIYSYGRIYRSKSRSMSWWWSWSWDSPRKVSSLMTTLLYVHVCVQHMFTTWAASNV